jgi:hypothetical protein
MKEMNDLDLECISVGKDQAPCLAECALECAAKCNTTGRAAAKAVRKTAKG